MNVDKINKKDRKKRILLAPLDWGLGHATRCIPIIKLLFDQGAEVLVAAEGPVALLLQKEFPSLVILPLRGYRVSYSTNKSFFFLKMLSQSPAIVKAIKHEKSWLNHIIIEHEIDAVISDNRFGFYKNKTSCVFITHQLSIPAGNKLLDRLSQKINYRYINKFSECWVPDLEGKDNLAGELSHPKKLPGIPVRYLGILSRCEKKDMQKEIDLLIVISGPEPQRTIFENILLKQSADMEGRIVFLRGLPAAAHDELLPGNKNTSIHNHLPASALNELIQRSKLVVARCGYSTIMDLAALKQKAILIPTPGQTEQEWLAKHVMEKKIFYTTSQENFSLKEQIKKADGFEFIDPEFETAMNKKVVIEWLDSIQPRRRGDAK
jgi:UDP:flavonoid glycosyltransferase YjiC (YdhE family)